MKYIIWAVDLGLLCGYFIQGRALLHWASDRGHKDLVSVLLVNNADIDSQVSDFPLCARNSCFLLFATRNLSDVDFFGKFLFIDFSV